VADRAAPLFECFLEVACCIRCNALARVARHGEPTISSRLTSAFYGVYVRAPVKSQPPSYLVRTSHWPPSISSRAASRWPAWVAVSVITCSMVLRSGRGGKL
jgi:hypothetical protein